MAAQPWPFAEPLPRESFVARLQGIYEHSPWVAERAWRPEPFAGLSALHGALTGAVERADSNLRMALIRAHPELAPERAVALTPESAHEQRGAGLDHCGEDRRARMAVLNTAYAAAFGFPFIIAVRGHTADSIIAAMETRLARGREAEIAEALRQIHRIAWFRLTDRYGEEEEAIPAGSGLAEPENW